MEEKVGAPPPCNLLPPPQWVAEETPRGASGVVTYGFLPSLTLGRFTTVTGDALHFDVIAATVHAGCPDSRVRAAFTAATDADATTSATAAGAAEGG